VGSVIDGHQGEEDVGAYCRQIEAYLCSKNDGHLIRIAGPSFDRVCGWARLGIPLNVVLRGIDRYVERRATRGTRRRPVFVDFCEPDILDVFDEWRRAVGVASLEAASGPAGEGEGVPRRGVSLARHLERVIARLTAPRPGGHPSSRLDRELEAAVRELDAMHAGAKGLRGELRARAVGRLREIDRAILASAREDCPPAEMEAFRRDAGEQLQPFRDRMPDAAFRDAVEAAVDRLLGERRGLPRVAFE